MVKATDSKSVSLWERRFESYQLRDVSLFNFTPYGSGLPHRFLDSLVVRISACHVEGPGSIPGRGENILSTKKSMLQVRLELTTPAYLFVLSISTVR